MTKEILVTDLDALAGRLRRAGQVQIADELDQLAAEVRTAPPWHDEWLTAAQAATALGVRSVNTVKRWAQQGRLEGWQIGGRVLVSSRSVDSFRQSAPLRRQQAFEHDLAGAAAPFQATPDEVAELDCDPIPGRTPWRSNAPTAV